MLDWKLLIDAVLVVALLINGARIKSLRNEIDELRNRINKR